MFCRASYLLFNQCFLRGHGKYGIDKSLPLLNLAHFPDSNFSTCEKIDLTPPQAHHYNTKALGISRTKGFRKFLKKRRAIQISDYAKLPGVREAGEHLLDSFNVHPNTLIKCNWKK